MRHVVNYSCERLREIKAVVACLVFLLFTLNNFPSVSNTKCSFHNFLSLIIVSKQTFMLFVESFNLQNQNIPL